MPFLRAYSKGALDGFWFLAGFHGIKNRPESKYKAGGSNIEGLIARAFGQGLSINDSRTSLLILQDLLRIQSSCREPGWLPLGVQERTVYFLIHQYRCQTSLWRHDFTWKTRAEPQCLYHVTLHGVFQSLHAMASKLRHFHAQDRKGCSLLGHVWRQAEVRNLPQKNVVSWTPFLLVSFKLLSGQS